MSEQFYISQSEEWFSEGPFDSREAAKLEGFAQFSGESFYIAEREDYIPFIDNLALVLMEQEESRVYDECGSDAADNWPMRPDGREEEIANEKIRAALLECYGEPTVFCVTNVEQIQAVAEAQ